MAVRQNINELIYLDDLRPAPPGYTQAWTFHECIYMLTILNCSVISLDHDLGPGSVYGQKEMTGMDVLNWLESRWFHGFAIPHIEIHTANASARPRMQLIADKLNRSRHGGQV